MSRKIELGKVLGISEQRTGRIADVSRAGLVTCLGSRGSILEIFSCRKGDDGEVFSDEK